MQIVVQLLSIKNGEKANFVRFFFKACEEIRQKRRDAEGVRDSIAQRDQQDSSRKNAPLKPADDAFIIDTGKYTINEVVSVIESHLKETLGWK